MPPCKNDPKRNYKGTEPSPKGLGWCGHAEKIGSKRKGKDGNIWIVKCFNSIKRWVIHNPGKCYHVEDNGSNPFKVCIADKIVYIYASTNPEKIFKKYKVQEVYIGKSTNPNYPGFIGNTVLLQLSKHKFVSIGESIYSFTIDDDFVKYYSNMHHNDTPYAVLLGTKNVYFLLEKRYVNRKLFTGRDWADAYGQYYSSVSWVLKPRAKQSVKETIIGLDKKSCRMKNIKVIHKRIP